jgi:alanyl-tRNA synthetase
MKQGTNAEQFDETIEEVKVVQGLTVKEIKKIVRPTFEKNPELFYPTKVFEGFGFHRNQCPKCQHFYWRKSVKQDTCGDSGYQFKR